MQKTQMPRRLIGPGKARVLRVYEDTLDLDEEHDIQDDLTFVTLPVMPVWEKLKLLQEPSELAPVMNELVRALDS